MLYVRFSDFFQDQSSDTVTPHPTPLGKRASTQGVRVALRPALRDADPVAPGPGFVLPAYQSSDNVTLHPTPLGKRASTQGVRAALRPALRDADPVAPGPGSGVEKEAFGFEENAKQR
eukprot:2105733-Amphidinium_carterae.1